MKRIYTSYFGAGEGAVYRELAGCFEEEPSASSEPACAECIDNGPVGIITGPGCSSFPVTNNNYGALPTIFAGDVTIDTYGYDSRFEDITSPFSSTDPTCPTPPPLLDYPDLWTQLEGVSGLQEDVLDANCYCPGAGIDQPTLSIGNPRFPRVAPLPFFAFPNVRTSSLTTREINPDGPYIPGECCPGPSSAPDHIFAEIIDGELRLQRKKKRSDLDHIYRADDTHESLQLVAGFPRECCMTDPCSPSNNPEYVLRDLHFPRWPGPNSVTSNYDANYALSVRPTRNPYGEGSEKQEPLGLIPRVVDLQCHTDGLLYVYYANDIVHDGHLAGLQWNTLPPRHDSVSQFRPANLPPIAPEDLQVNQDYQDRDIFDDFDPIGEYCDEDCNAAAANIGKTEEGCVPTCPTESLLCADGEVKSEVSGTGATESEAAIAALQNAIAATPEGCDASYYQCYVVWDEGEDAYRSVVAFCCPPGSSS
jgi:hypothetical protein